MKASKEVLLDYYAKSDYDAVSQVLDYYLISEEALPLTEIFYIFEDTTIELLIQKITAIIIVRAADHTEELIQLYQTTTSRYLKRLLMSALCSKIVPHNIMFLTEHLIKFPKYRDDIIGALQQEPESALLALANYMELHKLTYPQEEVVINFLSEIDPDLFYKNAGDLGRMNISDLFYAVRPEIRKKQFALKKQKQEAAYQKIKAIPA